MPSRSRSSNPRSAARSSSAKSTRARSLAQRADRHILYQQAVQCVEAEIDFVDETFTTLSRRKASRLREDFCGTAATSCEWVRRRSTNTALAVDLDANTLAWGRDHNLADLHPSQRRRLQLLHADVLDAPAPDQHEAFDIVLAMNFSYWCLKERALLVRYFSNVHASLAPGGVFFMDSYGGPDALRVLREPRHVGRKNSRSAFTYVWHQARFNSITNHALCHIHFKLSDGSWLRRAFTYDWRVWSLPEIRDALLDAGFSSTTVYWEGDDGDGGGNGVFTPSEDGEPCKSFICYISARK